MATRRHRGAPEDPYKPLPLTPESRKAAQRLLDAHTEAYARDHAKAVGYVAGYLGYLQRQLNAIANDPDIPQTLVSQLEALLEDMGRLRRGIRYRAGKMGLSESEVAMTSKPKPLPRKSN